MKKIIIAGFVFFYFIPTIAITTKEELATKLKAGIQQGDLQKVKNAIEKDPSLVKGIVPGTEKKTPSGRYSPDDRGKNPLVFALNQQPVNADIVLSLIEKESSLSDNILQKIFATNNEQLIKGIFEKHSLLVNKLTGETIFKAALSLKNQTIIDYITQKKFDMSPEQATQLLFYAVQQPGISLSFIKTLVDRYNASATNNVGTFKFTYKKEKWGEEKMVSAPEATALFAAIAHSSPEIWRYLLDKTSLPHIQTAAFDLTIEWCSPTPDRDVRCSTNRYPQSSYLTIAIVIGSQEMVNQLAAKGVQLSMSDILLNKEWMNNAVTLDQLKGFQEAQKLYDAQKQNGKKQTLEKKTLKEQIQKNEQALLKAQKSLDTFKRLPVKNKQLLTKQLEKQIQDIQKNIAAQKKSLLTA